MLGSEATGNKTVKKKPIIKRLSKLFTIHLCSPTLTIVMLYGVTAPKHVPTNCKSCKIEQHGLLLGLITLSDHQMY